MPTKRAILSELSADELRTYVDYYELEVADRRMKAGLINALVGCEEASIEEILGDGRDWYRDDLKDLCRKLSLDDSGTKKADLVARLIGSGEEQGGNDARESESRRESGRARKGREKANAGTNDNGATTGYEAELWAMADKLRGNMEPSDYKHVALGLIFLKYISDAFEAKRADLLKDEVRRRGGPRGVPRRKPSSGSRRKRVGRISRPRPSNRRLARTSTSHAGDREDQRLSQGRPAQGLRPPSTE